MRRIVSILSLLMLLCASAFAQNRTVTGRVTDAQGQPVPFASVTIRGTTTGTSADANGNFTIQALPNATLVFTASGFTAVERNIGTETTVNASLAAGQAALTEVVVTALGQTRSRAKVGYSTKTFNNETLNRAAPISALEGLQGKIAGADISHTGGPGASTKVVLRGYGIIGGGNNQPLYVVDGIPLSDARFGASSNTDFGNAASDINPADIESLNVLPGTAATSLYGSNARNGAIIITTKRGRSGKLRVEYNGSANFSSVGKLPDFQKTFGQGWGGVFILSENGSWGPKLDGKDRLWGSVVDNSQLLKPFSFINDNMRNFYDVGVEFNNTVALSGGGETTNFYFSYGNVTSNGVIPTTSDYLQRNTLSLRTNSKFGDFSIGSSFNYINRKMNAPFTGQGNSEGASLFEEILQIPVDIKITDFKDYKNKFFNVNNYFTPFAENPYYALYENSNSQNQDRFFGSLDLNYRLKNGLAAQVRVGGDFTNARTFAYKAVNDPTPGSWNAGGNPEGQTRARDVGSVDELNQYIGVLNGDALLKYNKSLSGDFSLEALAGYNFNLQDQKSTAAGITDLLVPGFYNLSNSTIKPTASDFRSRRILMGLYGQALIGWKEQLYLTLNARNDWSSTLPINNNSFFYPGANLAWVASQTFNLANTPISLLKFRAAYGKTGSDASAYQVNTVLTVGNVNLPFGSITFPFNGVGAFGISNILGNPDLQPVITSEAELGTEIRLFRNRLGLDLSVYDKKTSGQIFTVPIAPSSGYTGLVRNLGVVRNRGIEATLDAKPVAARDFNWALTYTFSKNRNKVENLTGGPNFVTLGSAYDAELRAYPGKSATAIYAPVAQYTEDGRVIVNAQTGLPLVAADKAYYGDAQYDYMMGMVNTLTYKNLSLNFSLDFRKGGVMYSGTADLALFVGNSYVTTYNDRRPFIIPNSVVQSGTDANGKPIYAENTTPIDEANYDAYWYPTTNLALAYQNRIIDRSFLKLRDVTLSYNLPKTWASKIRASNLSISLYGRNFLLWTPESNIYLDPEASNLGNDISSQLGEFRTAPISKQFGVQLRAAF